MKVLYDHQSFSGAKYGGIARYFYDLMYNLKFHQHVDVDLALLFSNNHYLQNADIKKVIPFSFFLGYAKTNMMFSHINRFNSALKIARQDFDVFHPTYFKDYFQPFLGKKPFVITHHDVIPEKFSTQYASLDGFDKPQKQKILDKAAKIIAVSENTKQDLLEIFSVAPEKIEVIYHSTHFATYQITPGFDIITPEKYLLYIGNRENYKNFDFFVKAITPLLKKDKDLYLVCGGNGSFSDLEQKMFAELKVGEKIIHQEIENDDVLYRLYQKAIGFVYPSLYEGFGIPILEAFACGCPVALSDCSCFPEVAQDAALYFKPDDEEQILYQIEQLVNNAELRFDLIKKGYLRLKDFSPEITAQKTLEVYKSVVKKA
ncbi:glycosyltransferase family 4 protein [Emticicia sp. SJ17W-69]|uniref:glycosyltransferase family 4 protein n=1 Tax=Emticicia sp. SJ17W-69 TaxID=3421657 RepID=UPI003EBA8B41